VNRQGLPRARSSSFPAATIKSIGLVKVRVRTMKAYCTDGNVKLREPEIEKQAKVNRPAVKIE
ncbi:MAG: hypothetical protein WCD87_23620, partial [Pseudolabrys sp.]